MKAAPLLVAWHNDNTPIYSADFESHGKGRLATAGGDNNVRVRIGHDSQLTISMHHLMSNVMQLWKIEGTGEDRTVSYLSTLLKHTQAVNVVRWCPRGQRQTETGQAHRLHLLTIFIYQVNCSLRLETTAPSFSGFHQTTQLYMQIMEKRAWRTKRHGG